MKSRKIKKISVFLILLTILPINIANAEEEFETEYDVVYDIKSTGETQITQDITITNKKNSMFATNYTLSIKQMHIYDIYGSDRKGALEIETTEEEDLSIINVEFNEQIVGEGMQNKWQLKYKSPDIASKVGKVWNIHIPKVEMISSVKKYDVTVNIPNNFGSEIYVSPKAKKFEEKSYFKTYFFDKETLKNEGITASFGEYQILNYKLNYKLKNDSNLTTKQEIALPPDLPNRQQIYIKSLKPLPLEIYEDEDNNIIAVYKVQPNQELKIELIGSVKITGKQIQPEFGGKRNAIPSEFVTFYTGSDTFWEVYSDKVREIAKELYNSKETVSQNAQQVYNYLTNNLEYDFDVEKKDFIERKGALNALSEENPVACMGFTDSFISLTRAMGIPSRELNGFAYTLETGNTPLSINLNGGDLLHAWAEYYDPNFGWVPVDPTWGTTSGIDYFTKLDTNHFAFVIKGRDSEYPFPAGTYKIDDSEKQVEVDFAINPDENVFSGHLVKYTPTDLISRFSRIFNKTKHMLYNDGGTVLYNLNGTEENILPYETKTIYLIKSQKITYRDFNGVGSEVNIEIVKDLPRKNKDETTKSYIIAISAGLVLCTIFYLSLIHQEDLKKVFRRLRRRPQDPNQ